MCRRAHYKVVCDKHYGNGAAKSYCSSLLKKKKKEVAMEYLRGGKSPWGRRGLNKAKEIVRFANKIAVCYKGSNVQFKGVTMGMHSAFMETVRRP